MDKISLMCNLIRKNFSLVRGKQLLVTQKVGMANYIPSVRILSWVVSLHLYKLLCSFQAVEILKTAREISMRVRFFPYSKCRSLFCLPGRAFGRNSLNTNY